MVDEAANSENGPMGGNFVIFGGRDRRSSGIVARSFMRNPFRSREISGDLGCELAKWIAGWRVTKCQNGTEGAKIVQDGVFK